MKKLDAEPRTRVLIVDDHPAVREALVFRINRQRDMEACGEAADSSEALRLFADARPDAAVLDISLKTSNGIDLIKRFRDLSKDVRVVVWSMHPESLYAERALRAGALGYVSKDQATNTIVDAIRRVRQGRVWLSESMMERLVQRSAGAAIQNAGRSPVELLADRELEVFLLIGRGVKTVEIADRLHLSVKTVETYRDRIRQKLALPDGTRLAYFATQWVLEND